MLEEEIERRRRAEVVVEDDVDGRRKGSQEGQERGFYIALPRLVPALAAPPRQGTAQETARCDSRTTQKIGLTASKHRINSIILVPRWENEVVIHEPIKRWD